MDNPRRWMIVGGGVIVGSGIAWLAYAALYGDFRAMKEHAPDEAAAPGHTGWRRVDALLPRLREIAGSSGIPLGLLTAWISKESGGRLAVHVQPGPGDTSMDERGYFQLTPKESAHFGLDHARLSTDPDYSLSAGVQMIREYEANANALNVAAAPPGSEFHYLLTKLWHTVGGGQTKKWVKAAQAAGAMGSWDTFAQFVLGQHWTGPQPKKWIPFLNEIRRLGEPFGFGSAAPAVAGFFDPRGADPRTPFYDPHGQPGCFSPRSVRRSGLLGLDLLVAA